jgi:hypothetical protein
MTDRKLRVTLSAAAWCAVVLWSLALLSSATALVSAHTAMATESAQSVHP